MNKISLCLLSAAALLATGCAESKYEVHQTFFYPQRPGGMTVYADQPSDTTRLYSLDSWTLRSSAPEWFTCTPESANIPEGYSSATLITVNLLPNTTGQVRSGQIQVDSYDQIGMAVIQYPWHNVIIPAVRLIHDTPDYNTNSPANTRGEFVMNVAPAAADTTIVFRTYVPGATLSSNADWLTPERTDLPEARRDTVRIALKANTTGEKRTATLTLSSAGVSTPIKVVQDK